MGRSDEAAKNASTRGHVSSPLHVLIVTPVAFTWLRERDLSGRGGPRVVMGVVDAKPGLRSAGPCLIDTFPFGSCHISSSAEEREKCRGFILDYNNLNIIRIWWPGRDLNPRRQPFQGCRTTSLSPLLVNNSTCQGGHSFVTTL